MVSFRRQTEILRELQLADDAESTASTSSVDSFSRLPPTTIKIRILPRKSADWNTFNTGFDGRRPSDQGFKEHDDGSTSCKQAGVGGRQHHFYERVSSSGDHQKVQLICTSRSPLNEHQQRLTTTDDRYSAASDSRKRGIRQSRSRIIRLNCFQSRPDSADQQHDDVKQSNHDVIVPIGSNDSLFHSSQSRYLPLSPTTAYESQNSSTSTPLTVAQLPLPVQISVRRTASGGDVTLNRRLYTGQQNVNHFRNDSVSKESSTTATSCATSSSDAQVPPLPLRSIHREINAMSRSECVLKIAAHRTVVHESGPSNTRNHLVLSNSNSNNCQLNRKPAVQLHVHSKQLSPPSSHQIDCRHDNASERGGKGDGPRRVLSNYEADEISSGLHEVYYLGDVVCDRKLLPDSKFESSRISSASSASSGSKAAVVLLNNGMNYDDAEGFYNYLPHDHIAYRYEMYRMLGRGSFGAVVRAFDHKERRWVAIKIIRSEDRFRRQAADEVNVLQTLNRANPDERGHVVRMLDHFDFRSHTCIVFEPLGIDLYEALRRRRYRGFPLGAAKRATKGIVRCLDLLSQLGIIHCDLKPENILLTMPEPGQQNSQRPINVKVIDFGSSVFQNDKMFAYVQSRFYRAPEVLLGAGYGLPIDVWSLGCIVAELVTGRPLFAGDDEADQLVCQVELLGMPPNRLLSRSRRASQFFSATTGQPRYCTVSSAATSSATEATTYPARGCGRTDAVRITGSVNRAGHYRGPPGSKSLTSTLLDIKGRDDEPVTRRHQDYVDFVRRCLAWEPAERLKPAAALSHSWLQSSVDPSPSTLQPNVNDSATRVQQCKSAPIISLRTEYDSFNDENLL